MKRALFPTRQQQCHAFVMPSRMAGATLVEVLMSLLIMSVGIVSVFSLFPISIVSSIRATQLTHGKIFKDNIAELLYTVPELMRPPVGAPWNSAVWKGNWKPFEQYAVGDIIVPTAENGKLFPFPYYALRCQESTGTNRSGATQPDWNHSTFGSLQTPPLLYDYVDSGIRWKVVRMPNFVVDPFGFYRSSVETPEVFGNRDQLGQTSTYLAQLPRRTPGPVDNEILMARLFSSPDSWSVVFEEIPTTASANGSTITFPASVDVGSISNDNNFPFTRLILTTADGTQSIVRYPTATTGGNTLTVTEPLPQAPSFAGPARLETYSSRYSCLIAVSNTQEASAAGGDDINQKDSFPPPKVSVAVIFNRQLSSDAEYAYTAAFGTVESDQIILTLSASEPDPNLKVGNYIMDAKNALFYRITAVSRTSTNATVTVNQPIEKMHQQSTGLAILIPGIVHVYNLEGVE